MWLAWCRKAAYTVWNQKTGARASNYGSRVDFILAAGPVAAQAAWNSPDPTSSQASRAGACRSGADPSGPVSVDPEDFESNPSLKATATGCSYNAVLHQVCCAVLASGAMTRTTPITAKEMQHGNPQVWHILAESVTAALTSSRPACKALPSLSCHA